MTAINANKIKDLTLAMLQSILALNNAHATETGPLDMLALEHMIANAFFSKTDDNHGLLISFDQDAPYNGENFRWFKERFDKFVYVDRVIVAKHTRGKGLARHYYTLLFGYAKSSGHDRVTCEINLAPPNPVSMAFHEQMGFAEIGRAALENGKTVSYQEKRL
jgi:predicted GNAT superfamily acetyltransferase